MKIEFEESSCGACNSDSYEVLYSAPQNSLYSQCQIVQCSNCGLVRTNPRPNQDSLLEVYGDSYYSRKLPSIEGLSSKIKILAMKHKLSILYPYLIPLPLANDAVICDVGCGSGQWLSLMRAAYPKSKLYGFEIDQETAEIAARSANAIVHSGNFLRNAWNSNSFDFIVFWDVLEHVKDPINIMQEVTRLLKPNGHVVVISPDFECVYSRVFKQFWWALLFDQHLYHFSRKTLSQLFTACHLEPVIYRIPSTLPHAHWNINNILKEMEFEGSQQDWRYTCFSTLAKVISPFDKIQLTRVLPQHLMVCARKNV